MVKNLCATVFSEQHFLFSDYFGAAAAVRGRPPSASGMAPGYDLPGTTLGKISVTHTLCLS